MQAARRPIDSRLYRRSAATRHRASLRKPLRRSIQSSFTAVHAVYVHALSAEVMHSTGRNFTASPSVRSADGIEESRAQPVATADGPKRPWLISNVSRRKVSDTDFDLELNRLFLGFGGAIALLVIIYASRVL